MKDSRNLIRVQQLLFGYDRGHALIASSDNLAKNVSNEILSDTDWDPRAGSGVMSYLSGYPCSTSKSYVLMKTWQAPEMPRPGCVWTHALLIDYVDFSRITNLGALARFLKKPSNVGGYNEFSQSIDVDLKLLNEVDSRLSLSDAQCLANIVYGRKTDFLPDMESNELEEGMLALWSQQWPELRRRFSFRLISPAIGGATTPSKFAVELPAIGTQIQNQSEKIAESTLEIIAEDIAETESSRLRRFLWRYGADTNSKLIDLVRLSRLFGEFFSSKGSSFSLRRVIEDVSNWYPSPSQANLLKSDIASSSTAKYSLLPSIDQLEVAQCTLSLGKSAAYPELMAVDLATVSTWIKSRPSALLEIMATVSEDENSFVESLFAGIDLNKHSEFVWGMLPGMEEIFLRSVKGVFPFLADDRVKFVSNEGLLSLIETTDGLPQGMAEVIPYILSRDSLGLVEGFVYYEEESVVSEVIKSISVNDDSKNTVIGGNWIKCVRNLPDKIIDFACSKASKRSQLLACRFLLDADTKTIPLSTWSDRIKQVENDLFGEIDLEFKAFLLVQALKHPEPNAMIILEDTFDSIYEAMAGRRLHMKIESKLLEHLPENGWLLNWDKSLRLKKGVLKTAKRSGASRDDFLKVSDRKSIRIEFDEMWRR